MTATQQTYGNFLLYKIITINDNVLDKIINILNSDEVMKGYTYSGRFKIGHRQLSSLRLSSSFNQLRPC